MAEHWTIDDLRTVLDRPRGTRLAPGEALEDTPGQPTEAGKQGSGRRVAAETRREAALNVGQSEGISEVSPPPHYRSKTEARFALLLDQWQREHQIAAWRYEALTLRLSPEMRYTPDFVVQRTLNADTRLTCYEVKGNYIRDRALHKPKAAAVLWPQLRFVLAQWTGGVWLYKEIPTL